MDSSHQRSPVLVEHSSPPVFPHSLSILNSPLSLAPNYSNDLGLTREPSGTHTHEQETATMDSSSQTTGSVLAVQDNVVGSPTLDRAEDRQSDQSQSQPAAAEVEASQRTEAISIADPDQRNDEGISQGTSVMTSTTSLNTEQTPVSSDSLSRQSEEHETQRTISAALAIPVAELDSAVPQNADTPAQEETPSSERTTQAEATDEAANEVEESEQISEAARPNSSPADEVPAWVKFEDDTSVPDEEEMKEIENSEYDKLSAVDISAMEEQLFTDVEDPEQRPVKKLRLSWVIRGVRGTKERPNFARVMNSPGAYVDGLYWSIKFYPRGDNCSSLSAFVRCSREPPPEDEECPVSEFSYFEGPPDVDFSKDCEPITRMTVRSRDRPKPQSEPDKQEVTEPAELKKQTGVVETEETDQSTSASDHVASAAANKVELPELPSWRVSAQLGMAIYNPEEPRTGHIQSDGHQFSRHCDDWGWVNFVGPWDEIHKRKRGQRQALLRKDTLAIDAYVRIYDDPTEALWWHESKDENMWPSKELAGYFPMGTPGLYHSPAVAGLTSWLLLAPFRELLQSADGSQWKTDSNINPKPLICRTQLVLDQMRNLSSDCYVNVYRIIEEFVSVDENWSDVKSFWEVFRRGLELEFADRSDAVQKLSNLFDADGTRWNIPSIPVRGAIDFQQGLSQHFETSYFRGPLPNFLPVMLNRSEFDAKTRDWRLNHDRVSLNDELDLSAWCTDTDSSFILYGFVVHVGPRNSGKFYTVLRPGGTNTKWLAFEDGNGNKVFSYSRKRIQDFEGLEDVELRKSPATQTRENVYMAMFIRKSCFEEYLPGSLEPYRVPKWLKPWTDDFHDDDNESEIHQDVAVVPLSEASKADEDGIKIELYLDECAEGCEDMLQLHELRTSSTAREMCRTITVATDKTFKELRTAIAQAFEIEDHSKVCLWEILYHGLGNHHRYRGIGSPAQATFQPLTHHKRIARDAIPGQVYRVWLSVQQPLDNGVSYRHLLDRLNTLGLENKAPEEESKGNVVADEKAVSSEADTIADATVTLSEPINADDTTPSGLDAEQASVEAAVANDVETLSVNRASRELGTNVEATIAPAPTDHSESSEGEDDVMTPTSSARSVVLEQEITPEEPSTEVMSTPTTETTSETPEAHTPHIDDGDDVTRPVVHGHLVDAAEHAPDSESVTITRSSAHILHGDADALAQVLAEEVSAHDAQHSAADEEAEAVQAERESQNRTPIPTQTSRGYGILHWFDADNQRFLAKRPFHPEYDMEIGTAIRLHMGYDERMQYRVWKRLGSNGTESVNSSTTFGNADLGEVFTLIVGEAISESKCEELKAAGKFWQPQQLISYLGMLSRKHPYAALTSQEPVELEEAGGDYYKGPLSRGRPHGEGGHLITATGHSYEGPFVAGQKSGKKGKMIYQNGDIYIGDWLNDERHGQGEFVEQRTGNRYVGGFENGKRWGQGTTYWQVADQQADMCQICYEEEIDALFYDCGHVCACVLCAKQCDTCPICRRSIRQVVKMFRA